MIAYQGSENEVMNWNSDAGFTLRVYARDGRDRATVVEDVLARAQAAGRAMSGETTLGYPDVLDQRRVWSGSRSGLSVSCGPLTAA
jgi:hypothetical protein